MDERINIQTKKMTDGSYQSVVRVNGEIYAEVRSLDRDQSIEEARYYAMQIKIDEWGNW